MNNGLVQDENHPNIRTSADPLTLAVQKIVGDFISKEIASLRLAIGNVNTCTCGLLDRVSALEKGEFVPPAPVTEPAPVDQSVYDRLTALEDKLENASGCSIDDLDDKISDLDNRIDDLESQVEDKAESDDIPDVVELKDQVITEVKEAFLKALSEF